MTYNYIMGLKIGDTPIPDPAGYKVTRSDLDTVGKRNANGTLIRKMVASKYKVEISYENIEWRLIVYINSLIQGKESFSFTFIDPFTNDLATKTVYCGDRSSDTVMVRNTGERIGSLSVNFIEI